jgi:hypothetical protein
LVAFLSLRFDWRDVVGMVRPETVIRSHRAGWRSTGALQVAGMIQ